MSELAKAARHTELDDLPKVFAEIESRLQALEKESQVSARFHENTRQRVIDLEAEVFGLSQSDGK